jgi:hypothetical protein
MPRPPPSNTPTCGGMPFVVECILRQNLRLLQAASIMSSLHCPWQIALHRGVMCICGCHIRQRTGAVQPGDATLHIANVSALSCGKTSQCSSAPQALSTRFVLNQKWWLTYAGVLSAAYLYLRPLIRRQLGSAEQGYINFYSVYIAWLCSAVFLHLPSVGRLGVDFKADLSILLTTFLVSNSLAHQTILTRP